MSNRSVSGFSRGSYCPGYFPDNFRLEVLDHRSRRGRSLSRTTTCVAAAKLELIDPLAAPTLLNHGAHLHRSLAGRRRHHNYRHSTASRRANAAATIAAPLHAGRSRGRTAASVLTQRPRLSGVRAVGCRRVTWGGQRPVGPCPPSPAGHGRAARSLPVVLYCSQHVSRLCTPTSLHSHTHVCVSPVSSKLVCERVCEYIGSMYTQHARNA